MSLREVEWLILKRLQVTEQDSYRMASAAMLALKSHPVATCGADPVGCKNYIVRSYVVYLKGPLGGSVG